jgi:hypothetical protein
MHSGDPVPSEQLSQSAQSIPPRFDGVASSSYSGRPAHSSPLPLAFETRVSAMTVAFQRHGKSAIDQRFNGCCGKAAPLDTPLGEGYP